MASITICDSQFEEECESICNEMRQGNPYGPNAIASDGRLASSLLNACNGKQDIEYLNIDGGGVWGPKCNAVFQDFLAQGLRVSHLHLSGVIRREEDCVDLLKMLQDVETLNVSYGIVGIDGLRAMITFAKRCEILKEVDVFNTGPRTEKWESLGCFTGGEKSEDCVLLLRLYNILHLRQGNVRNEAFMDDVHGGGALLEAIAKNKTNAL